MSTATGQNSAKRWQSIFAISAVLLIIVLTIACFFLLLMYKNALRQTDQSNIKELTQRIGQVIDLPLEEPTIATILDIKKLSNQVLADKAQNNDQLIIYTAAKKMILYRPSIKKVVEILAIQNDSAIIKP